MTPQEFKGRMELLIEQYKGKKYDPESQHGDADDLLCRALSELGFHEGVALYESLIKWYA